MQFSLPVMSRRKKTMNEHAIKDEQINYHSIRSLYYQISEKNKHDSKCLILCENQE